MWMSFITSGVKMLDDPRMYFFASAGALGGAAFTFAFGDALGVL